MDVALAVGSTFLSGFLQVAFDRIASSRKFIDFFQGKSDVEFDEETLDRLQRTLDIVSIVLEDVEDKPPKYATLGRLLDKLKDEVNEADDLLDEINTEFLRLKVDYESHLQQSKTYPDVIYRKLSLPSNFIEELMPNLKKITKRLESFVNQIDVLGMQRFKPKEKFSYRAPLSSSVVDNSQIFGRDDEKEKLIQMVLSDEGGASYNVSVIAITGLGGIGKTTLAQLVYNDDRVKTNCDARALVCVSEEYDPLRVTKSLLMEVNSDVVDDKDDFNRVQVKLRDNVLGKRFLIILDDIWNLNYIDWQSLKNPLNHGSRGSKIIVTTRNENIALMMQNEPFHHMQPILEDESWSLFKSHAFDNGDHTSLQEFETIGKKIVKKCKGLPLAIKMVAGALRPKGDINVWHDILSSEIWTAGGDVQPSLNLSYKHLPSHLKCCFSFCAIFPKDIPFKKDEVVLLWMANDLVQPSTQKVGRDYFDELKSRSLFMVNGNEYLMHDLVNDLARSVNGNSSIRLEDYQVANLEQSIQPEKEFPPKLLHFSYSATQKDTSRKFRALSKVHSLRTFLPIPQSGYKCNLTTLFFSDVLPRFRRLRALTLSQYRISVVPDSIGDLKHLRLLNLARTNIRKLPNTVGKCLNLQTVILKECEKLEELPEDMRLLINLLHLDVRGVGDFMIKRMESWLSILKDIRNLSIVVDKIHGSVLEQLGKFQLCPSLKIIGLEHVVTVEVAEKAELKNKNCIENLSLEWSGDAECSKTELNMFIKLEPHTNIKHLSIKGYRGTTFPNWLGDSAFSNMESLFLEDCKNCFFLPPFGQLTALKKLHISGMDGITSMRINHLDKLKVCRCPSLVSIPNHFDELVIIDCPSLSLSLESSLVKHLVIEKCKHLEFPPSDSCNSYLKSIKIKGPIKNCDDFVEAIPLFSFSKLQHVRINIWEGAKLFIKFPNVYHQTFTTVEFLYIYNCNNILSFPKGGLRAPNLKQFMITNCKKLKSLPEQMHTQLLSLNDLAIRNCPAINCFPEGGLPSSLEGLDIFSCKKLMICQTNWDLPSSLKTLRIHYCKKLMICQTQLSLLLIVGVGDKLFPEEGLLPSSLYRLSICRSPNLEALNHKGLQHLTSLQTLNISKCLNLRYFPEEKLPSSLSELTIRDCPKLKARMKREKGEDWPKVSHIPFIYVDGELIS